MYKWRSEFSHATTGVTGVIIRIHCVFKKKKKKFTTQSITPAPKFLDCSPGDVQIAGDSRNPSTAKTVKTLQEENRWRWIRQEKSSSPRDTKQSHRIEERLTETRGCWSVHNEEKDISKKLTCVAALGEVGAMHREWWETFHPFGVQWRLHMAGHALTCIGKSFHRNVHADQWYCPWQWWQFSPLKTACREHFTKLICIQTM